MVIVNNNIGLTNSVLPISDKYYFKYRCLVLTNSVFRRIRLINL